MVLWPFLLLWFTLSALRGALAYVLLQGMCLLGWMAFSGLTALKNLAVIGCSVVLSGSEVSLVGNSTVDWLGFEAYLECCRSCIFFFSFQTIFIVSKYTVGWSCNESPRQVNQPTIIWSDAWNMQTSKFPVLVDVKSNESFGWHDLRNCERVNIHEGAWSWPSKMRDHRRLRPHTPFSKTHSLAKRSLPTWGHMARDFLVCFLSFD